MKFPESVFNIVPRRRSVRTYADGPVGEDALEKLKGFVKRLPEPPLGSGVRFAVAAPGEGDAKALKGLGTYGVIRNPAGFVIGAVEKSEAGLVDFGYLMEAVVLFASSLGIGSCWLGGSFRKTRFSEKIGVSKSECVPSVISFGMPSAKPRTFETLMRKGAGSDSRKPFDTIFFQSDFMHPLSGAEAGDFARVLDMVRLAPSASNRQPWRIVAVPETGAFHFFLQRDAAYSRQLKWFRLLDLQRVDMGIAACHFELSAREAGFSGNWRAEDPGLREPRPANTVYIMTWFSSKRNGMQ
jgi:nitroreductase